MKSKSAWIEGLKQRSLARRFLKNNDGIAAVEFALIATPFFFLIFACMELGLLILLSITLDASVKEVSRQIRTGQMTQGTTTANGFKDKVCTKLGWLANSCQTNLTIDINTYNNFNLVPIADPLKDGSIDPAQIQFTIGTGSSIQMVRAYYNWSLFTPFIKDTFVNSKNGKVLVSSKTVFRNEPF